MTQISNNKIELASFKNISELPIYKIIIPYFHMVGGTISNEVTK